MHAARITSRRHEDQHTGAPELASTLPPTSAPTARSVTASASMQKSPSTDTHIIMAGPSTTAGQFAFTPATQQTTVVTTTTTTVSLPPFVLKPPRDLQQRDPKQYPLACSPTPASLRRVAFGMGDRSATYNEADSPEQYLRKVRMAGTAIRKACILT